MTISEVKAFLLWSTAINYGILILWFSVFVCAHNWLYRMHTRWFKLSVETFDALTYMGVSIYKIAVVLLNLVPLIILCIIFK